MCRARRQTRCTQRMPNRPAALVEGGEGGVGRQGPLRSGWDSDGRGAHRPLPRLAAELEVCPARARSSSKGRVRERRAGSDRRNKPGWRGGQAGALSRTRPHQTGRLHNAPADGGGGRAPRGARPRAGRAKAARPGGWNPLLSRHALGGVPHVVSDGPLRADWFRHRECESPSGGVVGGGDAKWSRPDFGYLDAAELRYADWVGRTRLRGPFPPVTRTGRTWLCFQPCQSRHDTSDLKSTALGGGGVTAGDWSAGTAWARRTGPRARRGHRRRNDGG